MIKNKFKNSTNKFKTKLYKSIKEIQENFPNCTFFLFKVKHKKHLFYVEILCEGNNIDLYIDKNFDLIVYQ